MPTSEQTVQTVQTAISEQDVWRALEEVCDPEIPVISLVDLGVIHEVRISGTQAQVTLLPTFLGCPALGKMRQDVEDTLRALGLKPEVKIEGVESWTSDMITPAGRERLRESGFAPPSPRGEGPPTLLQLQGPTPCPYCGSKDTKLENLFGPTPCRSLRYCSSCRQPFEQFKAV